MDDDRSLADARKSDHQLEGEVITAEFKHHSRLVELRTVENVMEDSYLRYSMSVIIDRALPDVRDGLKPVHRRILYSYEPTTDCALLLDTVKAPMSSVRLWVNTIRMVMSLFTMQWYGWLSPGQCVTC